MPQFEVPYGKQKLSFELPDRWPVTVIAPAEAEPAADPLQAVREALAAPVGAVSLGDFAGVRTAAIAINDKTRPVPHDALLPPLLAALEQIGLPPEAITLVIAAGAHPPMPPGEYGRVVPADILARYPVICHDCDDAANLAQLGTTSRGTPAWMNRHFLEADLRIVVGNIEPHQFMGFSGGVKAP
jgi:nickel-dependent lactate racemase